MSNIITDYAECLEMREALMAKRDEIIKMLGEFGDKLGAVYADNEDLIGSLSNEWRGDLYDVAKLLSDRPGERIDFSFNVVNRGIQCIEHYVNIIHAVLAYTKEKELT